MEYLGKYWENQNLEIYKIDNRNIVLNNWNGEFYYNCFEVASNLIDVVSEKEYQVKPIYKEKLEDEFEIVGYEFI